ncbi:MerR family transcriptional regulator [Sediminivirga luteola]|jgi:DNA-binding transcriptional MerR regulator|uniref:MerR family transcriptional regulator n=1 Tax=Sediminivirga luteola TaxID=1774748 RepID=A0A8J2XJ25_9MICO|nr:MerR family transcriptional regulator [Sediminivirga luteola]MCI2265882.1 MerR family transcriptional regulator [Sediminivirga luteola]GGA04079.1 MerR family transcriptional regulator [Sediminivirga luteola]
MRSAEIARLAGVTVRTLRHYHQVGLLAEPPRTSNGYRDYAIQDLVRLLRIRQLAALGVPLEQMPAMLDGDEREEQNAAQLLEELDRELAQQIERLSAQRDLIARLRSHGASPDVPPDLAPFHALFTIAGYPRRMAQIDRDQVVLLSHFSGEPGRAYLAALYEQLSQRPELIAAATVFTQRFDSLDETSSDEQIALLVDDFAAAFGEAISALLPGDHHLDEAAELIEEYGAQAYNAQQQKALGLLTQRLSAGGAPDRS